MRRVSLLVGMLIAVSLIFIVSCVTREVPVTETYYETEYKTEYKTEAYTTTEDVVVKTVEGGEHLTPILKWSKNIYFESSGGGVFLSHYYGYQINAAEHSRTRVEVNISSAALGQQGGIGVYDLTGLGQIAPMSEPPGGEEGMYKDGEYVAGPRMQAFLDRLGAVMTNRGRILGYLNTRTKGAEPIVFDAKRIEEFFIFANTWNTQSISSVKLTWADDIIETKTVSKERQVPYQVPVQVEKQRTVMKTVKVPFWQAKPAAETPSTAPVPQPPSPPM